MSEVLAVGPHPDDIELAAGGTVALLARAGHAVVLLDLTRGERATRGTPASRDAEARAASEILGARRECLGLPDGGVNGRDPDQLRVWVEALRRHRPRLVLALSGEDDHPDHREAAELVARGIYLSGLRKYPDAVAEVEPYRPGRVLYGMGRRPFAPSLVVDVSAVYEVKRRALAAYGTQFRRDAGDSRTTPISDPEFLPRLEARDRYFGGMIGATHGEPFAEPGPAAVRDAGSLLPGAAP